MVFTEDNQNIGLHTRKKTQGAELELVNEFVGYYCTHFSKTIKSRNLAVFFEPRIVSGFPDIVFAEYSPSIVDYWSKARMNLDIFDLKVLLYLMNVRESNGSELLTKLRLPERQVIQSIEKLLDATLISRRQGCWKPCNSQKIFSIKKLMAVEAKIGDIQKVTEQSLINTWFASQSYALVDSSNPKDSTIKNLQKQGVGLYCKNKSFKRVIAARDFQLPSSFGSLQFNEWIGNHLTTI